MIMALHALIDMRLVVRNERKSTVKSMLLSP